MVAAGKAGPAPEVMARRRRWERFAARMYAVLVIVTMAVAVPVSGWVWWNRPIPRSVALPAGVEEGKIVDGRLDSSCSNNKWRCSVS